VQSLSLRDGIAFGLNIKQARCSGGCLLANTFGVPAAQTVAAGVSPAILVESGSLRSAKFLIISRTAVVCAVSAQDEMNFGFTPLTTADSTALFLASGLEAAFLLQKNLHVLKVKGHCQGWKKSWPTMLVRGLQTAVQTC
jgi:hypothetical protein